jgi:hypothetical protein
MLRITTSATGKRKPIVAPMLAIILMSFSHAANAAEILEVRSTAGPEAALERYMAAGGQAPWATESIEIQAALPKLEKTGRLLAIRHLEPTSESRYEVVQLVGDPTVKEQVIMRYLQVQQRAAEIPVASVAIASANYKFAYKRAVDDGERQAYVFQITPRHKREGLIKGELWLDERTGVPIRQSGRLVKSPSIFIKRVAIIQENTAREGIIESRLTHITIETRLVGRAELVIEERPLGEERPPASSNAEPEELKRASAAGFQPGGDFSAQRPARDRALTPIPDCPPRRAALCAESVESAPPELLHFQAWLESSVSGRQAYNNEGSRQ